MSAPSGVLRVAVHGAAGRMGRAVIASVAADPGTSLAGAVDPTRAGVDAYALAGVEGKGGAVVASLGEVDAPFDVVIDFSTRDAVVGLAEQCRAKQVALVTGTTGLADEAQAALDQLAKVAPVVAAPNMSVGVTVLFHLAEKAAALLGEDFDAEIVEMHHRHKVDAPSGTAARLTEVVRTAKALPEDAVVYGRHGQVGERPAAQIGVMTLRGGDVVGDHTLVLAGPGERVELTHRAHHRGIFANGAVRAAKWAAPARPGRYDMTHVLGIR